MLKNRPIVFFDSGVGGLPYLRLAQERLPSESFIYVCDSKNFPYGTKSAEELCSLILMTNQRIVDCFNPKAVVVACNTASVVALGALREAFDIPFIGVVPAVKPAVEKAGGKRIAVIATQQTTENDYLRALIHDFAPENHVLTIGANFLVDLVENHLFSSTSEERIKKMQLVIDQLRAEEIDTIVLACTHFILLESDFRQALGPLVKIIDSRDGVVRQLIRVLENHSLLVLNKDPVKEMWLTLVKESHKYKLFAEKFDLDYRGGF
ncbi:MAG: glutamate racemase [Spirochaetales bacterium]|nr:glutamate racemase [Spirochaetales bacterium]